MEECTPTSEESTASDENSPADYAVFVKRDPSRFVQGKAKTWLQARSAGARRLKQPRETLDYEDVWAQVMLEGDTVEQAVKRGVRLLKESAARLKKKGPKA